MTYYEDRDPEDLDEDELREELRQLREEVANQDFDPPCDHHDESIGTVWAGNRERESKGPLYSVTTCADCVVRSLGYVQLKSGIVHSSTLLLFPKNSADDLPGLEEIGVQVDRSLGGNVNKQV